MSDISSASATVAAISTPPSAGGIGIVRISGEDAVAVADRVFRPTGPRPLSALGGYRAAHGRVVFEGRDIDECVALVFRGPKSYTGEDVVELCCHGGLFLLQTVLRAVLAAGAVPAAAGEFTKRAFLNGKLDLTEAEAVMDLIGAQSAQGAKAALSALDGALSRKIRTLCGELLGLSAQLAAWVDYPDDEIEELQTDALRETLTRVETELSGLLSRFDAGRAVTEGVETAIIGKPNVGKSALMNLLSGFGRSIVTDIAGTTRDVVEQTVRLGDLVLRLADTAGIHETSDVVERIGVSRAKEKSERAGLVFAVFDRSEPLDEADAQILALCRDKHVIAVLNKSDLPARADEAVIRASVPVCVPVCALNGDGLEQLEQAAAELLCVNELDTDSGLLTTERQRQDAEAALAAVREAIGALDAGLTLDAVNVSMDDAIGRLLSLTGERVTDAVVDEVFSRFCVGK